MMTLGNTNNNMEGTMPIILSIMEGTPPLAGRALPNLLMRSKC